MSSNFDYSIFTKEELDLNSIAKISPWDRYVSGFNLADRVRQVFRIAPATKKHWLLFPEYRFDETDAPVDGTPFRYELLREDEYILKYFDENPIRDGERLCFDITGFMRPHLLFLIRYLAHQKIRSFDCIYSEPQVYEKADATKFSGGEVKEIRQIAGFEGNHTTETENDILVVGCGYDHILIQKIAEDKKRARKIQLFPFPSLKPHMYQESRLRTQYAADAFGANIEETLFAPAHDPFATAAVLANLRNNRWKSPENLYLSPLATKPQVAGFALFYVLECINSPTSIIFPITTEYSKKTSDGVSQIWRYQFEF